MSHNLCPYVQRSIILLDEKNISHVRTDINLANKPPWFSQISPMGKVPVLLVDDKKALFESNVICEYLDESTPGSLHPKDHLEKAFHRSWIEFGSNILAKIANLYNAKNKSHFYRINSEIHDCFKMIEKQLSGTGFFSGEKFHLIDAVYGPIFRYFEVFDTFIKLDTFAGLSRCQHWRSTLMQRKSVQNAVVKEYPTLLQAHLINRKSYMSSLI